MSFRRPIRLVMSEPDSRRVLELFGPVLAREAEVRRRRLRRRVTVAAVLASVVLLAAAWWGQWVSM